MNRRQFLSAATATGLTRAFAAQKRPNILLIVADDLGWSDLGCYGGEIHTPNLDRLARGGVRFTQFYNTARCCPSRASILTGLHPHQAGMGNMTSSQPRHEFPGYTGVLNDRNVMIPEVLKKAGYSTWMAGKWHLGPPGPVGRGFDEYYGMVHGFDSFWDRTKYTRLPKGRPERSFPEASSTPPTPSRTMRWTFWWRRAGVVSRSSFISPTTRRISRCTRRKTRSTGTRRSMNRGGTAVCCRS